MTYSITDLPLYEDAYYTYKVNIEGESRKLVFSLNKRTNVYHLDIYSEAGEPIVLGIPLLPKNVLLNNYALEDQGITGYLILLPVNSKVSFPNVPPSKLSDFYKLLYVYEL